MFHNSWHGSDAAEVTDVHEAGAGEVGEVVGKREVRITSRPNTKIADKRKLKISTAPTKAKSREPDYSQALIIQNKIRLCYYFATFCKLLCLSSWLLQ